MKKLLPLLVLFLLARNASAALSAQTTVWNETCGNANGAIQVDASGGQWPMTIAWSTGPTGWTITDLTPGWYIFTITDADSQVLWNGVALPTQVLSASQLKVQVDAARLVAGGVAGVSVRSATPEERSSLPSPFVVLPQNVPLFMPFLHK